MVVGHLKLSTKTRDANIPDKAMSLAEADAVLAQFGYVEAEAALVS